MEEKKGYRQVVKKITSKLMRGDIMTVCNAAGTKFNASYYSAIKKNDWSELSPLELRIINAAVNLTKDREVTISKMEEL